jgi:hypothetical protein
MGRGRSKAKQTKVARDLKYSNQDMDLDRLAQELHSENKNEKVPDEHEHLFKGSNNQRT